MKMLSTVNYGYNFENAFWNGIRMTYGKPGEQSPFKTFMMRVIAAHEVEHGITQFDAGTVYRNQPGALNEHFSDVGGVLVDMKTLGSRQSSITGKSAKAFGRKTSTAKRCATCASRAKRTTIRPSAKIRNRHTWINTIQPAATMAECTSIAAFPTKHSLTLQSMWAAMPGKHQPRSGTTLAPEPAARRRSRNSLSKLWNRQNDSVTTTSCRSWKKHGQMSASNRQKQRLCICATSFRSSRHSGVPRQVRDAGVSR